MLHIFQDFDVTVRTLLSKVEPSALSVFPLLDMEKLPTWAVGKLVLLGDAAHPFTPRTSVTWLLAYMSCRGGWVIRYVWAD